MGCCDVQSKIHGFPVIKKPYGCTEVPAPANYLSPGNSYLPLTKADNLDHNEPNNLDETVKLDTMQRLNNLCFLNRELLEGAWLDNIIWEPSEDAPKPKLIFDLRDDQMLFEILDEKNADHLRSHARAMIVSQSIKTSTSTVENFENQAKTLSGRFNISNDKFYSNRKMSQQAKSHTKKRALMGIKVVHSAPAHKLQTMKPILSNKEIANFHRPKAKWYPHENKIAAQLQGAARSHGRMTVILMTLGGKGLKFVVNAEETPVFIKSKASKKLEFKLSEKIKLFCSGKELQDDISLVSTTVSVFDDEDYDEDEEPPNDTESLDDNAARKFLFSYSFLIKQNEMGTEEAEHEPAAASLPVLCIEDGSVILRFSEIFGIQEPARKVKTNHHKRPVNKDFTESDSDESISDVTLRLKDSCLSEQPMKNTEKDICTVPLSPVCPEFYPLEHGDWENAIIWDNSPATGSQHCLKSCVVSEEIMDTHSEEQDQDYGQAYGCCDVQSKIHGFPVIKKPYGCTEVPAPANYLSPGNSYLPLTKADNLNHSEPNNLDETVKLDTMQRLNNLCLLNRELLEGAWLDNIIWEPSEDAPKPKLIFDLRDDQMLFEILDEKNADHLRSHARAMIVSQSIKTSTSTVENFENQAKTLSGRFNISNDKFYSNRKMSQQAKISYQKTCFNGHKGRAFCSSS
ncbi:hypothetical protein PR202_ga14825 [Eleusine coracana subsp. coracana]|uniref:Ubiquitin-like domain-containing protein n=1 Tax=Eleusine coracana subsp. coracana TaxID=191504 RepID=A0AAV5CIR0_ELECO|nr:hypothetical protein PR202_ga14825 [Eleusine coracana subsp. coracana]